MTQASVIKVVISNGTCNDVHFVILSIKEDYASVCTVEPRVTDTLGAGILSFVGMLFPSRQGWESGADKPKVVMEHEVMAEIILMLCACLTYYLLACSVCFLY